MDDKFLYQNRPPVRPGFSESLYAHLLDMKPRNKVLNKTFKLVPRFILACMFVFVMLFTFSRTVRADVLDWIKHIAGFNIEESTSAPVIGAINATTYYYTPQPLPTALKDLPFTFNMPVYIPNGFVFNDNVVVAQSKSWASLSWVGRGGEINLLVQQNWDITIPTRVNGAKEVNINGQPAILIQGWWDASGRWDQSKKSLQLYWRKDGLIFTLSCNDTAFSKDILSEDELIRIAESIR